MLTPQGSGDVYVETLHNGFASSQVHFRSRIESGKRTITENSVSLIDGHVSRSWPSGNAAVRYQNYLQYRGVRPGQNTLTFQIERYGSVEVRDLKILSDSGIEVTNRAPGMLVLRVEQTGQRWQVGHTGALYVLVRNGGGRSVGHVRIGLEYDADALHVQKGERELGTLRPHQARRVRFDVEPKRRGRILIGASGSSTANQPGDSIEINVG